MNCRFTDFRCKEVINIHDGCRLGYVGDVECRLPEGELSALIVPGPFRFFGLFGRGEEYYIPWESIKQIGARSAGSERANTWQKQIVHIIKIFSAFASAIFEKPL